MPRFEIGDTVYMPNIPILVEVLEFGTCTEEGCDEETFRFDDPNGLGSDWMHSSEFERVQ